MVEVDWDKVKSNTRFLIKLTYWAVGFIIALTISYVLFTRFNKQVASLLVFIATMLALYYYYVKWFVIGDSPDIPMSFCPDFMTSTGTPYGVGSTSQTVCYDTTGVYQPNFSASPTPPSTAGVTLPEGQTYVIGPNYIIMPPVPLDGDYSRLEPGSNFCLDLKNKGISWIYGCKTLKDQIDAAVRA